MDMIQYGRWHIKENAKGQAFVRLDGDLSPGSFQFDSVKDAIAWCNSEDDADAAYKIIYKTDTKKLGHENQGGFQNELTAAHLKFMEICSKKSTLWAEMHHYDINTYLEITVMYGWNKQLERWSGTVIEKLWQSGALMARDNYGMGLTAIANHFVIF